LVSTIPHDGVSRRNRVGGDRLDDTKIGRLWLRRWGLRERESRIVAAKEVDVRLILEVGLEAGRVLTTALAAGPCAVALTVAVREYANEP
jgi:hypothetical protein